MSDTTRTVREMHHEAMTYALEACYFTDDPDRKRALFRKAADLERQCVERVRDIPDNEPTFSILSESLAALEATAAAPGGAKEGGAA